LPKHRKLTIRLNNLRLRWFGKLTGERAAFPRPPQPIALFCHHKTRTVLLHNVFNDIGYWFGWRNHITQGVRFNWHQTIDIAQFANSALDPNGISKSFRGIHVVRNPVSVLVSGYHYHQRTNERWCVNRDFSEHRPITPPRVFPRREHYPEEWKIDYLRGLKGSSYQETVRQLPPSKGLSFELEHATRWPLEDMRDWRPDPQRIKEIQFEQFSQDFDGTFTPIFQQLNFLPAVLKRSLKLAGKHDLSRSNATKLTRNDHYTGANSRDKRKGLTHGTWSASRKSPRV